MATSTQRINLERRLTGTRQMPIGHQVILVQLDPGLYQLHLPTRQSTFQYLATRIP